MPAPWQKCPCCCKTTLSICMMSEYTAFCRYALLGSAAFCQGMLTGPLVGVALEVDPSLVFTAFLGTSMVFACFSGAALVSRRRSWLFLGGAQIGCLFLLLLPDSRQVQRNCCRICISSKQS